MSITNLISGIDAEISRLQEARALLSGAPSPIAKEERPPGRGNEGCKGYGQTCESRQEGEAHPLTRRTRQNLSGCQGAVGSKEKGCKEVDKQGRSRAQLAVAANSIQTCSGPVVWTVTQPQG